MHHAYNYTDQVNSIVAAERSLVLSESVYIFCACFLRSSQHLDVRSLFNLSMLLDGYFSKQYAIKS